MAAPNKPPRKWEDIEVGETRRSQNLTVSGDDMIAFARKYDPQYFHADPEAAKDSLFGGVIASGIYTAALWRIMDHTVNGDVDYVCGVAWDKVTWRAVRAGDTLYATSVCVSKRPSASRPNAGIVVMHHDVISQNGETVFAFDSTDLVYRRQPA
jgi:acyl dehydratase